MNKRTVQIRNARIVPAETIWPGRCQPDDMVLVGELASVHQVLGVPQQDGVSNKIRTSLVVKQDLSNRRVETMNTIYEVVQ